MKISLPRIETAILFAILFILIGIAAPMAYVSVAPDSHFVEVHEFDAADTHTDAKEHNVCFNRTVYHPSDAEITIELVLLRDDGSIVEEDSFSVDAYYQQGQEKVIISRNLDTENLRTGKYRYVHSVELVYYDGRATKKFVFTSDTFQIYDSKEQLDQKSNKTTC